MRIIFCIFIALLFFKCSERSDDSNLDQLTFDPKVTTIKVSLEGEKIEFDKIENGLCDQKTTSKIELSNTKNNNHLRIKWKKGKDENHFVFDELPTLKLKAEINGLDVEFFLSPETELSDYSMFHTDRKVHHLKGAFTLKPANNVTKEAYDKNPILEIDVQKAQIK